MKVHNEIAKYIGIDDVPAEANAYYGTCPCCKLPLTRFNSRNLVSIFCKESCKLQIAVFNFNVINYKLEEHLLFIRIDIEDTNFDFSNNTITINSNSYSKGITFKRVNVDFFNADELLLKIKMWNAFS